MPLVVVAGAPWSKEEAIDLYMPVDILRWLKNLGENTKLAEYAGLVHGDIRELFAGVLEMEGPGNGLTIAHGLFRGLERPLGDHENDKDRYIYVSDPPYSYDYVDPTSVPRPVEKRLDCVFVTYCDIPDDLSDSTSPAVSEILHTRSTVTGAENVQGLVIDWEWVPRCPESRLLPRDSTTRYSETIWSIERSEGEG